jgi:hypothetical protein
MSVDDEDRLSPEEERVREVLAALREDEPEGAEAMRERVAGILRWQRPLRRALVTFGTFADALAGGVRALVGRGRS